jgi:hypothetical protein
MGLCLRGRGEFYISSRDVAVRLTLVKVKQGIIHTECNAGPEEPGLVSGPRATAPPPQTLSRRPKKHEWKRDTGL